MFHQRHEDSSPIAFNIFFNHFSIYSIVEKEAAVSVPFHVIAKHANGHHCSVDPTVPTMLRPQVQISSITFMLFSICN